jgi:hypothetical protein
MSTTRNPWPECAVLNCEKQHNFGSKIWFNLELGSGAMGHVGHLRHPKCMFMRSDHISTTLGRSAWLQIAKIRRISLQKFGSIWSWIQVLWITKEIQWLQNACSCLVITSTTVNPWEECTALNSENQRNFGLKIWFNLELVSGTVGYVGNLRPLKCMFMCSDPISIYPIGVSARL